jgi:glycine oxidase
MQTDVVVIGGGVIGLSVAYALALESVRVTVLDRQALGRSASWAGAGMIAPESTRHLDRPEAAQRSLSAVTHRLWAEELREQTGIDTGYRRSGGLDIARTFAQLAGLYALRRSWEEEGIAYELLEGTRVRALEPSLRTDTALFVPGRAQIRNPWHLRALEAACQKLGVRLRPYTPTTGLVRTGDRLTAVLTPSGPIGCTHAILAAGAWSGGILRTQQMNDYPTPPVKGQIVLLNGPPGTLRHIVECGPHYLVPRDDGRILVGATEENAGYDDRPTVDGTRTLLNALADMAPSLGRLTVERTWAGLRPGNRDGRPYIGASTQIPNLILATGHRRHGLQLSTGTALVVADLVLGRPPQIPLDSSTSAPADIATHPFRS